jgi:hypothetical protein
LLFLLRPLQVLAEVLEWFDAHLPAGKHKPAANGISSNGIKIEAA